MSKTKLIRLTDTEIGHIEYLIGENKREGWYWGSPKHYWKRSETILDKLSRGTTESKKPRSNQPPDAKQAKEEQ